MRKPKIFRPIICCLFVIFGLSRDLSSLELLSTDEHIVKFDFSFSEKIFFSLDRVDFSDSEIELGAPALDLEWEVGADNWEMKNSLDFSSFYTNDLDEVIKKLYLKIAVNDDWDLQFGQFKVPLGMELNLSGGKRPYPGHTKSSGEFLPGYDRGINFRVKKLLDLLDLDVGLFNEVEISKSSASLTNLLPATRLSMGLGKDSPLDLDITYYLGSSLGLGQVFHYKIYQGIGVTGGYDFGKKNDLFFLVEFMECYTNSLAANNNPFWGHGIFASLAYRIAFAEPFMIYEHYKPQVSVSTESDKMYLGGGANFFLPADIQMQVYYEWKHIYLTSRDSHSLELNFSYDL